MALNNFSFSKALSLLCITSIVVLTQGQPNPFSPFQPPQDLAPKLSYDAQILSQASIDYGHIVNENPYAVLQPSNVNDIIELIKYSNSLPTPFTIAARGQGHSVDGQAMAHDGVVVNMTRLGDFRNGSGIIVYDEYVDVGGEQIWIDVLHATLERGLTPLSWTDYLYLSVGGTLSNAGISGQTFRFGPQISNVLELDVVTGKGDFVTCSGVNNSETFYAVLGGLGQFGIITRARIALGPAPTRATDYVEGFLLMNKPPLDLSFYPEPDQPRITSLVNQYSIIYIIELVKYYDNNSQAQVDKEVENLVQGLKFVPTFQFEKDVSYEEFLNRVHADEVILRSKGLWDVPHPWLNMFIPSSRISDFNEGVFKGIILKQNISSGIFILYPMNRNKWDDRMSAVIADEDVFYTTGILVSSDVDNVGVIQTQNQQILQLCKDNGIEIREYLTGNKTNEGWVQHFGSKWQLFEGRKSEFDPKKILSPGQGIFS
ncbi:hypothetical protein TanjilG_11870 [Lupinus angustifolius]|uniref:cytokinin dehydrogenase n=1 Tax=Lupinus angustifolius TaxID=3871 RepID=A0A394DBM3_LUPAN|nr:hypothetical protein TanjilG_11870 [Lupinus angustifolius]